MDIKTKKYPASLRQKAKELWLTDEYEEADIAKALGIQTRVLQSWRDEEKWLFSRRRIEDAADAEMRAVEVKRRVERDDSEDQSARLVEAAIARFLRDRLSGAGKLSAADIKAVTIAANELRKVKKRKSAKG